jgi:hypothetical protein
MRINKTRRLGSKRIFTPMDTEQRLHAGYESLDAMFRKRLIGEELWHTGVGMILIHSV